MSSRPRSNPSSPATLGACLVLVMTLLAVAPSLHAAAKPAKPAPAEEARPATAPSTDARFQILLAEQLQAGQLDTPKLRNAIREDMRRRELMLQQAHKAGIDQHPLVRAQADLAAETVYLRTYSRRWIAEHPVAEADIRKEYDLYIARLGTREVRLRQILVPGEEDAKGVMARLNAGEKFEDLAGKVSRDAAGRGNGGLIDWVPMGELLPGIAEAVKRLTRGQMTSDAVQSPSGWHILRLEDTRQFNALNYDRAKPQVRQLLEQKAFDAHVADLVVKAGAR